ncbi:MAG: hypothetical protein RML45_05750 [Acetobacteraceae bacterium]|nr:hypothetical protein [Acetobacteraceae bacterium]
MAWRLRSAVLIALAFRGVVLRLPASAVAVLEAAFDGGMPLLASPAEFRRRTVADFTAPFFPLFLLGAAFGKLMENTGSVEAPARGLVGGSGRAVPSSPSCLPAGC